MQNLQMNLFGSKEAYLILLNNMNYSSDYVFLVRLCVWGAF